MAKTNFMIILRKDIWCKTHRGSRVQGNRVLWNSQVWVTFPWVIIVAHSDQPIFHYHRWPEISLATRFLPHTIFILRAHFPTICLSLPVSPKEGEGFDSAISRFFQSCFNGDFVTAVASDSWGSFTTQPQQGYVYLTVSQSTQGGTRNSVSSPPFNLSTSQEPSFLPHMRTLLVLLPAKKAAKIATFFFTRCQSLFFSVLG